MSHLRISPRHLGQLLICNCDRCNWTKIQMRFRDLFSRPMPALMYYLDLFEKRVVQAHLDEQGTLPKWLKELCCKSTVDFPAKLTAELPQYDFTLVGMPDEVFKKNNGDLYLVDYKTALGKEDDPFLPVYTAQLNGYVHLLESNNIGTVGSAALVYFSNKLKDDDLVPLDLLTPDGFDIPFRVKIHEIEIDRTALDPLLKRMRELADMEDPPEGRKGCRDCALLQKLFDGEVVRRNAEVHGRNKDSLARIYSRQQEAYREAARASWIEEDECDLDVCLDIEDSAPGPMDL